MKLLNHECIIDGLFQFASEKEQRRLWLGEGQEKWVEVCSFVEAGCMLYDDSGLYEDLYSEGTEFGPEVDAMLQEIGRLTRAIDGERYEEEIIADPKMAIVRRVASNAHGRIMSMGRKNSERIHNRVMEWRDEERQRMLWLPHAGERPRSSPRCAAWHLFHGNDYWGYLDLGDDEDELSNLFWDLSVLVSHLTDRDAGPEAVLADPLMKLIREMAARIARKLGID